MFKGKTTLITGGTSGIGKAMVERFAKNGSNIIINGFNLDTKWLESVRRENNIESLYLDRDLNDLKQIELFADESIKRFGKVDILINNAGITEMDLVINTNTDAFEKVLRVNLLSPQVLMKKLCPGMISNRWGRVINITSVTVKQVEEKLSCYIASKSAMIGLTKVLAKELEDSGVTANCIMPGNTDTPLLRNGLKYYSEKVNIPYDQLLEAFIQKSTIKRLIESDEIAAMASFLSSNDASGITGTVMEVTGGHGL